MSSNRNSWRGLRLLPVAATLAATALVGGCAGGIGETLSLGPSHQPAVRAAAARPAADVAVEPLAVAEPEPGLFDRAAYPNLNIIPAEPSGRLLTPSEQKSVGAQLRQRAAAIGRGDGPLMQHMRQQASDLRQRVNELSTNGDEATPACAEAASADCPR